MPTRRSPGPEKRSRSRFLARVLPGAQPAAMPGFVVPCRPKLDSKPPAGSRWVHEIAFEGRRIQAHLANDRATLFAADGRDWTSRFTRIAAAVERLPAGVLVLDGMVIVQRPSGASDAHALEADLRSLRADRFVYYAFDLLYLDGFDVRAAPLLDRKRVLAALLSEAPANLPIAYSEHFDISGGEMVERVRAMGLAGVVSKDFTAPYRSGTTDAWVATPAAPAPTAQRTQRQKRMSSNDGGPLLVIDGDSFAHRAYHAIPKSIRRAGNKGGGAIVGFANYLVRFWESEKPRAVLVAWDTLSEPNWRAQEFDSYQSGREFDDELVDQLDVLPELVAACGFQNAKAPGYEADDFLAAAVAREEKRGGRTVVASGDRDSFQLASDLTTIIQPVRAGELARIGPAEVRERYGVEPKQVPDFIALRGDPSDKIPGANGVGAQGAASLLRRYPSLEAALADGKFAGQADELRLYRRLATMDPKAPLPALKSGAPDWKHGAELARAWELRALATRLDKLAEAV
jgi:DNA polymerase I